jgi:hypothetical protein
MPHIVLTEEQTRVVVGATEAVQLLDPDGRFLASLQPLGPEDLAALEHYRRNRDRQQPTIPGERVQALLQKLHQLEETEGVDRAKVDALLLKVKAGEAP